MRANLVGVLRDRARAGGWLHRPAYEGAGAVTHAEVYAGAARVAGGLRAGGVQAGDRVVLLLDDGPDFVSVFLGAATIGAVATPVNPRLHPDELRAAVVLADPALVVCRPADLAALHGFPVPVLVGPPVGDPVDPVPCGLDVPAFALLTSGTTGAPRLCPHHHADPLVYHRAFGGPVLGLTPQDVVHSVSKMHFAYGLGNSLFYPLLSGCRAVLDAEPATPDDVLRILDEHGVTTLFSVPTFYARLLAHPRGDRLGALRLAVTAGEVLPPALEERLVALLGDRLLNGIGTTEVGQAFTSNAPQGWRAGTVGRALPPYEVRVVDEAGAPVGPEVPGRLEVRGPTVTLGMRADGSPQRTSGWSATGDLATVDGAGYVRVSGRADDVENVGGIKVHPVAVEHLLAAHPLVREAVVCAETSGGLLAYVVRGEGDESDDDLTSALLAACRERLTAYKVPRTVVYVPALPRTGSGKLRRHVVRTWESTGLAAPM
ncbi:AMP-binding protein [Actinosynnema sp. NPDC047251]|uniref:AMP-dependent synthetase and ligase n=1 Tax=Saccharothrix espanaensis (strain ATCC 51144 / DSM 44229 / JCM 9112 / NBRC 15066 / NRRL 15764) TaxID=1179773 RepID=K0K1Z6_SACES|nr:AMP-binding protein [Saccharothrix espanaensis]CCH30889.1 AMP-dependent synthetase and ligase [Saccharothrix espanaensis DSM 44229]